jgi:hypothetical protein
MIASKVVKVARKRGTGRLLKVRADDKATPSSSQTLVFAPYSRACGVVFPLTIGLSHIAL